MSELEDLARALGAAFGWTDQDVAHLAEGEVEAWLARMAPAVSGCGAEVDVRTVESPHQAGSTGYEVAVGDERLRLFGWADGEVGAPDTADPWRDCTVLPAAALNRRLAAAGSSRRVGLVWAGANDGLAVLAEPSALASLAPRWHVDVP